MRRTKLVCTIGPASENEEILTKIIEAGMNASRLLNLGLIFLRGSVF